MQRILIVEDNSDLALGLSNNLQIEGYEVRVAETGNKGVDEALNWLPDMVILDLMLPGKDGFQVLKELREQDFHAPVLMLTARGEESDKVRGLRLGADDYVTKPFGLLELLARVEALLRRGNKPETVDEALQFDTLEVRPATREVLLHDEVVSLTPKEYDLLLALIRRRDRVVSREELMREVWGHSSVIPSRTVDTHVAELRKKLDRGDDVLPYVITVRKAGYRFNCG